MKCCICGTVRNCGSYLNNILNNMEKIGHVFADYRIILYYDNSSDNTLNIIKNRLQSNKKIILIENKESLLEYRTHRIALGRNLCIKEIQKNFSDYEYFIMMDCDDRCNYRINFDILNKSLNRNDWDALSFNHPVGYYDTWALSKRPYVVSCHHFNDNAACQRLVTNIINKTPKTRLIPCLSAFNGFSIYRTNKFINCTYDGRFRLDYIPKGLIKENIRYAGAINLSQDKQDCEHRHFHFEAVFKNNARIRINPQCIFI